MIFIELCTILKKASNFLSAAFWSFAWSILLVGSFSFAMEEII